MSTTKKTRFALLGLLSWKPMSGYDIKKIVDIGLSHFWNENYGQIYPTLESLVGDGLAQKSDASGSGKRKRYVYSITERGVEAFEAWLTLPADPPAVRNEFQLKFFLSSKLPTKATLRIIQVYRSQQQEILQGYRESEVVLRKAIERGEYPHELEDILAGNKSRRSAGQRAKQCTIFLLTLRHGILAIESRIAWCDEAISHLTT
jgi:DNA-binding PadR family transcriptional regulator